MFLGNNTNECVRNALFVHGIVSPESVTGIVTVSLIPNSQHFTATRCLSCNHTMEFGRIKVHSAIANQQTPLMRPYLPI